MPLLRQAIGAVLRRIRLTQGRTLRDVAAAADVSLPYLSELELGRKEPSSEVLAALCRALEVSLDELLGEVSAEVRGRESTGTPTTVGASRPGRAEFCSQQISRQQNLPGTTSRLRQHGSLVIHHRDATNQKAGFMTRFDGHRMQSEQQSSFGDQVFNRLLQERIIFLGTQVDDASANTICAQMLLLAAMDGERDIHLYINSPGGSISAGMAIYDTMQFIKNDVATIAMGFAGSMAQFLLCVGTPGKRYSLPHTRIMMHQLSGGIGGTAADIAIQAENMLHVKKTTIERIAHHTGRTYDEIERDSDRDRWFTAEEAKAYGMIDHVISDAAQINSNSGSMV